MFWSHHIAIAVALAAIVVLVAANTYAFNKSVGDIYSGYFSLQNDTTVSDADEGNVSVLREGVRWSRTVRDQVNIWCAVLFLAVVALALYMMYHQRKYGRR